MQTATLIRGTVKYAAGNPRETQFGLRINAVISLENGEETKLWDNPGGMIAALRKGQAVTLTQGKNGSYILLATNDPTPGEVASATPAAPPRPQSADVQEWLSIFEEVRAALPNAQENTWRAAASTLFMQRCKIRDDFKDF